MDKITRKGEQVVFVHKGETYVLTDHPYEPCIYIKSEGKIVCTLHNAFTVYDLPEFFAEGRELTAIDGKVYNERMFCKVLAAALDSGRGEMDFTFAASLPSLAFDQHQ